jgi:hypothetical protein
MHSARPGAASAAWAVVAAEVEQAELAGKTGLELGCHLRQNRLLHRFLQGHRLRGCRVGVQFHDLWITHKNSNYASIQFLRNYTSLRSLRRNPIFNAEITQNYAKESITHSTPVGGACPPHGS